MTAGKRIELYVFISFITKTINIPIKALKS